KGTTERIPEINPPISAGLFHSSSSINHPPYILLHAGVSNPLSDSQSLRAIRSAPTRDPALCKKQRPLRIKPRSAPANARWPPTELNFSRRNRPPWEWRRRSISTEAETLLLEHHA